MFVRIIISTINEKVRANKKIALMPRTSELSKCLFGAVPHHGIRSFQQFTMFVDQSIKLCFEIGVLLHAIFKFTFYDIDLMEQKETGQ